MSSSRHGQGCPFFDFVQPSIFLYACELWALTAELQRRIQVMEMGCYRNTRGSLCPDPVSNRTTRKPPDHHKETQSVLVGTCLPFFRSGQNHLARRRGRGKETRQTEKEVGRQHQAMDRPGVCQVPEGSGEQRKLEETGCEVV